MTNLLSFLKITGQEVQTKKSSPKCPRIKVQANKSPTVEMSKIKKSKINSRKIYVITNNHEVYM